MLLVKFGEMLKKKLSQNKLVVTQATQALI
jgi:hypothetical protein